MCLRQDLLGCLGKLSLRTCPRIPQGPVCRAQPRVIALFTWVGKLRLEWPFLHAAAKEGQGTGGPEFGPHLPAFLARRRVLGAHPLPR